MYFSKFFENIYYASTIESAQVVLGKKTRNEWKEFIWGKKTGQQTLLHIQMQISTYNHVLSTFGSW